MYQHKNVRNPTLAGGAGVVASAAILSKLVERGILTPADAHDVVLEAISHVESNYTAWAKVATEILKQDFLPAFPKPR